MKITIFILLVLFPLLSFAENNNDKVSTKKKVFEKPNKDLVIKSLEYPELPANVPEVKKLVDWTNSIIDIFNNNKTDEEFRSILTSMWDRQIGELKIKYSTIAPSLISGYWLFKENQPISLNDMNTPYYISVLAGAVHFSTDGSKKKIVIPIIAFKVENGMIQSIISFNPAINDNYFILLRRTDKGMQFITFTSEFFKEEGDVKKLETPWIIWSKDGKIIENTTQNLDFTAFNMNTILDGPPQLREKFPIEYAGVKPNSNAPTVP